MSFSVKNKAFSLVEMSMVLMIIGLIIVVSIRGKGLIESAKFRAETNKFLNVKTAINEHISKTNTQVPFLKESSTVYDINFLTEAGYLTSRDITTFYPGVYYMLAKCAGNENQGWVISEKSANICMLISSPDATFEFPEKLSCYLEASMDDKNYLSGDGRMLSMSTRIEMPDNKYWKLCERQTNGWKYAYRVFGTAH